MSCCHYLKGSKHPTTGQGDGHQLEKKRLCTVNYLTDAKFFLLSTSFCFLSTVFCLFSDFTFANLGGGERGVERREGEERSGVEGGGKGRREEGRKVREVEGRKDREG